VNTRIFNTFLLIVSTPIVFGQVADTLNFEPATTTLDKKELVQQLNDEFRLEWDRVSTEDLTTKQRSAIRRAYEDRFAAGKALIQSDDAILSGELYAYVNGIFSTILAANSVLDQNSKLVLYRSREFNAFTLGDNIVFVNIGLLARMNNKEQLALVLAHELSHNLQEHANERIIANVRLKTDEQLNADISKIKQQQYGQVSALNELMIPWIFSQKEQSRKDEFEADSLGMDFFRNAGYNPIFAFNLFNVMQAAEHLYELELLPVFDLLNIDSTGTIAQRYARYSPVSSLGVFSENKKEYESYLRTHPYEYQRTDALLRQIGLKEIDTLVPIDDIYRSYHYQIDGEMVHSAIGDENFSEGIYYALRMQQHYPTDVYAKAALAFQFSLLSFYKSGRNASKFVEMQNPKNDESIDRLNYLLQFLNPQDCLQIAERFRKEIPPSYQTILLDFVDLHSDYFTKNFDAYSLRYQALLPLVEDSFFIHYLRDIQEKYLQQKNTIKYK